MKPVFPCINLNDSLFLVWPNESCFPCINLNKSFFPRLPEWILFLLRLVEWTPFSYMNWMNTMFPSLTEWIPFLHRLAELIPFSYMNWMNTMVPSLTKWILFLHRLHEAILCFHYLLLFLNAPAGKVHSTVGSFAIILLFCTMRRNGGGGVWEYNNSSCILSMGPSGNKNKVFLTKR